MREIKFKVWDVEEKKMYQVGFPSWNGSIETRNGDHTYPTFFLSHRPECEGILLQFTCLKDKNGKEIYEGDIVEIEGGKEHANEISSWDRLYRGIVQWNKDCCCFDIDRTLSSKDLGGHDVAFLSSNIFVIGNIYETSELLENI